RAQAEELVHRVEAAYHELLLRSVIDAETGEAIAVAWRYLDEHRAHVVRVDVSPLEHGVTQARSPLTKRRDIGRVAALGYSPLGQHACVADIPRERAFAEPRQ